LKEDDMIEHWVGNGGDQKVIATVSNNDQSIAYKVYLQWEIDKGWKPTKVEKLKSLNIEQQYWRNIMTIGIIGAMDEEIALLQKQIKNQTNETVANTMYIKGTLETKDVVLVKSGIGKVNAAMTTAILMEKYQPTFVINTGSAGGFSEALKVGDV